MNRVTSAGTSVPASVGSIGEGKYTQTVYSYIRDGRFYEVIRLMKNEVSTHSKSRAALSLLAYSYYQVQDYASASDTYERLSKFYPEVMEYRFYYAQSLYKSAQYPVAQKVSHSIESPEFSARVRFLKFNITFRSLNYKLPSNLIRKIWPGVKC